MSFNKITAFLLVLMSILSFTTSVSAMSEENTTEVNENVRAGEEVSPYVL